MAVDSDSVSRGGSPVGPRGSLQRPHHCFRGRVPPRRSSSVHPAQHEIAPTPLGHEVVEREQHRQGNDRHARQADIFGSRLSNAATEVMVVEVAAPVVAVCHPGVPVPDSAR